MLSRILIPSHDDEYNLRTNIFFLVLVYVKFVYHHLWLLHIEQTNYITNITVPDHVRAQNNKIDFMERVKKASNVTSRVKRDLTNTTHYVPKPTPEYNSTPELQSYKRLCKGLDVKVRYEFVSYGL